MAANTAARHNAVTIGTANGLSLNTQVLSLGLASGSATGALSSTDWNTFNNKLSTATAASTYVPYTGATTNVNLGTNSLTAGVGSFASSGSGNTFSIDHGSGSGIALNITKAGNGEGLYINKTSGSGNAVTIVGTLNATTLVKDGGTSSQFLKADGSVDSSTYLTTSSAASTYLALSGGTLTGALTGTSATFSGILAESKTADGIIQTIGGNSTKANIYQFTSGGLAGAVFNIGHNFYYDGTNYGQGNAAKSGWVISSNLNADTFSIGRAAAGSTSAPTSILSFASTGAATFSSSVTTSDALISTDGTNTIRLQKAYFGGIDAIYQSGTNAFGIYLNGGTYTQPKFYITNAGNVGIGTTSPNYKFEVSGISASTSGFLISSGQYISISETPYTGMYMTGASSSDGFGALLISSRTDVARPIIFGTSNGSVSTERMRIASNGSIGIKGGSDINNANTDTLSIGFYTGNYGWIQTWDGRALYLNNSGNAVYAGSQRIDNNSDIRIKENIEPIQGALDIVLLLQGKKYNMLDENNILRYGFIAQEVQPHLSDFVTQSNRSFEKNDVKIENLLTLESSGAAWAALLVEAIKEQQAQIEELKALIAAK